MGSTGKELIRSSWNSGCSGTTVHSPERPLPDMSFLGPRGTRVLGDHCSWPRAPSPGTVSSWVLGKLGYSRTTVHGHKRPLPELCLLGSSGNSGTTVHGPERPLSDLCLLGSLENSGTTIHGPEHPSRNWVFSGLGEIVPERRRHVAFCCPGLRTRGPLVPMSPTVTPTECVSRPTNSALHVP